MPQGSPGTEVSGRAQHTATDTATHIHGVGRKNTGTGDVTILAETGACPLPLFNKFPQIA